VFIAALRGLQTLDLYTFFFRVLTFELCIGKYRQFKQNVFRKFLPTPPLKHEFMWRRDLRKHEMDPF